MKDKSIITVNNLSKSFEQSIAVNDISFTVQEGEIFGFLGPNGAGKTTTINMLIGLLRPDKGTIFIRDIDCTKRPKSSRHLIGVVPDESNLYPELTGFENLCFCAALYGLNKTERQQKAAELLKTFGLETASNKKFAAYSKGMKRKLTIAAAIIHEPRILFLDEPTTGIDVAAARQIRELIAGLKLNRTSIFLTTHYIEEAERLCDRIGFIVSGKIIKIDTVKSLLNNFSTLNTVEITCKNNAANTMPKLRETFDDLRFCCTTSNSLQVSGKNEIKVGAIVSFLEEDGAGVVEAKKIQPSLEDIFVEITDFKTNKL